VDNDSVSAPVGYTKILAPYDGSPGSSKALRRALWMARGQTAEVTVISVDEHVPRYAPAVGEIEEEISVRESIFEQLREQAVEVARGLGGSVKFEGRMGHAAQSILTLAKEGSFDLIVIGHTGHSGVWQALLGSTTARVVDHATCDVLVVR
jgi:nucleotide-binding universal stress UspA family protein